MLRYLEKQFESKICRSYRPFLKEEWEREKSRDMFYVNYGAASPVCTEFRLRLANAMASQLGKRQIVAEVPGADTKQKNVLPFAQTMGFYYVNGVNRICPEQPLDERESEYYTRLGYFLGEGRHPVNTALFAPDEEECRMFSRHGIPYHILTNTGMTKYGFTDGDTIGCGKYRYDYLAISSGAVLTGLSENYVRAFAENGGKILLLGEKPVREGNGGQELSCLESNCTFGRIGAAQTHRLKDAETEIYSTYRNLNGMEFLYAVNVSLRKTYQQTFDCGEKVHSFLKLDLMDDSTQKLPLTVTLKPGEGVILIPYA